MRVVSVNERSDRDAERYKRALGMIEDGYRELKELTEKMVVQFGERGDYGNRRGTAADRDGDGRYNERYGERGGYGQRDGYGEHGDYGQRDEYRRDAMGRYRD